MDVEREIEEQMKGAEVRYGPFKSAHEAYGVLAEEMAELLDAIRANASESVRSEAIQVSAVARRLAEYCRNDTSFMDRSGFNGRR